MTKDSGYFVMERLFALAVSERGRGHVSSGMPCQDASCVVVNSEYALGIVSDGAGSAKYSDEGAKLVVSTAANVLSDESLWRDVESLVDVLVESCQNILLDRAQDLGVHIGQLAATLAFFAIKGTDCIYGSVGDCLVIGGDEEGLRLLLSQSKGEFANETVFVTSDRARDCFLVKKVDLCGYDSFVLMSDGAAESLFRRKDEVLAPAVNEMLSWMDSNTIDVVVDALEDSVFPMLLGRTLDDCTLVLLKRVLLSYEEVCELSVEFQMQFLNVKSSIGLRNRLAVLNFFATGRPWEDCMSKRTFLKHKKALDLLFGVGFSECFSFIKSDD